RQDSESDFVLARHCPRAVLFLHNLNVARQARRRFIDRGPFRRAFCFFGGVRLHSRRPPSKARGDMTEERGRHELATKRLVYEMARADSVAVRRDVQYRAADARASAM